MKNFKSCPRCKKLNPEKSVVCAWCFQRIPTKWARLLDIAVFFGAIVGLISVIYVIYRMGQ